MSAPEQFCAWMSTNIANDHKYGRNCFRYHPRSDEHSKMLCQLVLVDLLIACPELANQARVGKIVGGINAKCVFPNGKKKTLDLAIGVPSNPAVTAAQTATGLQPGVISQLRLSCEAKQCMTEHGKTQPRIFDELSSSHEIVHQGQPDAIAAGIVVVNIAPTYASPTRQTSGEGPLIVTKHRQPDVTESMVNHLRGLLIRNSQSQQGFDAFATIVVDCDNVGPATLHTAPPAPQPGDRDHYETFINRISAAYSSRFAG